MKRFWLVGIAAVGLACRTFGAQGTEQDKKPIRAGEEQATAAPPRRDGFFTFVTKMVNPKDVDFGELIAERRNALADQSVNNPYFWYAAGSTATYVVLLWVLYFRILQFDHFRWRVAELFTDLKNSEKLATAKTRQAVAGYKKHMLQCNRVVEAEIAGRVPAGSVMDRDSQRTIETLRQKLEAAEAESRRLSQELQRKEDLVADLTKRIEKLEEADRSKGHLTQTSPQAHPDLMALVDRLTRQLDAETRKNGALKGA